jgi:hypothetical protein
MANGAPNGRRNGARVIDADKLHAARGEGRRQKVTLVFREQRFTLPPEMSVNVIIALEDNRIRDAISSLFGKDAKQVEKFFETDPSLNDVIRIIEAAGEVYGTSLGEAVASPSS